MGGEKREQKKTQQERCGLVKGKRLSWAARSQGTIQSEFSIDLAVGRRGWANKSWSNLSLGLSHMHSKPVTFSGLLFIHTLPMQTSASIPLDVTQNLPGQAPSVESGEPEIRRIHNNSIGRVADVLMVFLSYDWRKTN